MLRLAKFLSKNRGAQALRALKLSHEVRREPPDTIGHPRPPSATLGQSDFILHMGNFCDRQKLDTRHEQKT